jgi:hypothetical protein
MRLEGWIIVAHPSRRRCAAPQVEGYSKQFCARGRIALSGVDLRPHGPGGGSKRTPFRDEGDIRDDRCKSILTHISEDLACKVWLFGYI